MLRQHDVSDVYAVSGMFGNEEPGDLVKLVSNTRSFGIVVARVEPDYSSDTPDQVIVLWSAGPWLK